MTDQEDPVAIWRAMHGSRDFVAVVTAGNALCDRVERSRVAWRDAQRAHEGELAGLQVQIDHLQEQLEQVDDENRALAEVVRSWHHEAHAEPWAICSHWLCRHVELTYPGVPEHPDPPRVIRSVAGGC